MGEYQIKHYKDHKEYYQAYFFLKRNHLSEEPFDVISLDEMSNLEQTYYFEKDIIEKLDNKVLLKNMYKSLNRDRDKRIFIYMLNDIKVEEIRKLENISKQRASQLCKRIKEQLKNKFQERKF